MDLMNLFAFAFTCGIELHIKDETAGLDPRGYTKVGTMSYGWKNVYAAYQARFNPAGMSEVREDHNFRTFFFRSLGLLFGCSFPPLFALVATDGSVFVPNEMVTSHEFVRGKA